MAPFNENTTEILNDLIQINNDRIVGYEKALKELDGSNEDLDTVFNDFIAESKDINTKLHAQVASMGGEAEKGTTTSGKIYRAWMGVKTALTGKDRKSILASCEQGEDAAQSAYESALEEELPSDLRMIIVAQKQTLRSSHDEVKRLRDSAA